MARVYGSKRMRCERFARVIIDGVALCNQHGGELALNHLLQQQEKNQDG